MKKITVKAVHYGSFAAAKQVAKTVVNDGKNNFFEKKEEDPTAERLIQRVKVGYVATVRK